MTSRTGDTSVNNTLAELARALGTAVVSGIPLPVGFGLTGLRVRFADGREAAVKAGGASTHDGLRHLPLQAAMLRDLARSGLPVPRVWHASDGLLVMEWIGNDGGAPDAAAQRHAAELLAALHGRPRECFGYAHDTLIGPLRQPNPQCGSWIEFFRDHRLLHMAARAHEERALPAAMLSRLERFAGKLGGFLAEPRHPALIHGDVWGGNLLVKGSRVAGFIDPAVCFAHPEIELAFSTLFGTFSRPFFDAYEAIAGIEPGFHETRKDIYNLYPLLVHLRLFGGSYLKPIDATLHRLGH
ncbi:MAG: fructosamine kinase family protein [Hyphomicrobiales bacterium]